MENLVYRAAENEDIDNLVKLRLEYVKADYGEIDAETEAALRAQLNEYFPAHLGKDIFGFLCYNIKNTNYKGDKRCFILDFHM